MHELFKEIVFLENYAFAFWIFNAYKKNKIKSAQYLPTSAKSPSRSSPALPLLQRSMSGVVESLEMCSLRCRLRFWMLENRLRQVRQMSPSVSLLSSCFSARDKRSWTVTVVLRCFRHFARWPPPRPLESLKIKLQSSVWDAILYMGSDQSSRLSV